MTRIGELEAADIAVYFLSTDTLEEAKATVDKHGATFPVLYGMDGPKTAELLGAYYEQRRNIIQPTGFLLSPEKKILYLTISNGPVGRMTVEDILRVVAFNKKQAAG